MYKNNYGNFAKEKFTDDYIQLTDEEENWFELYGSEGFIVKDGECIINVDYPEELLQQVKEAKYQEALDKANYFLDKEALYELTPTFHVEATKENMNTLTSASIAIEKGLIESQVWTSKEDNVLELTQEQCMTISFGIGAIQGDVWSRQFIAYKEQIEEAETAEEVEAIIIDYVQPVINESEQE